MLELEFNFLSGAPEHAYEVCEARGPASDNRPVSVLTYVPSVGRLGEDMLGAALGFSGRLGRLQFLLWSLGLAAVLTILTMTMVFASFDSNEPKPSSSSVGWIVVVVAPIYAWGTIALVSKRFRDIGWNPLYVILGWLAFWCFDLLVTTALPAVAAGDTNHTYLGMTVDLVLAGALLLWPGRWPDVTGLDEEAVRRSYRAQAGLGALGLEGSTAQATPGPPTSFGRKRN